MNYILSLICVAIALVLLIVGLIAKSSKKSFQFIHDEKIKEDNIISIKDFNNVQAKKFFISAGMFLALALIMVLVTKFLFESKVIVFLFGILLVSLATFVIFITLDKELKKFIKHKKKRR